MKSIKKPKKCPSCKSRNIHLDSVEYKKDVWNEYTNIIASGSYFCKDCGEFVLALSKESDNVVKWYI